MGIETLMMNRLLLLLLVVFGIQEMAISQTDSTYQNIDEVIISSKRKKTIVFEDPKYYIVDFSVSKTQTFLLMKNFGTYYIYELDEDMNFRHKLRLKVNANSLFDDCFGNTHLVTHDSVYFIMNDSLGLYLTESHPRVKYMAAMEKCAGVTSEKFIFEQGNTSGHYQRFYTIDKDSSYRKTIYQINDSTIADNSRHSVRSRKSNTVKKAKDNFVRQRKRLKYNPLFVVNDTLYIFNHAEGRIDQLDQEGKLIGSREINYQRKRGWKKLIYSDKSQKQFYAVWLRNGAEHLIGLALSEDVQDFSSKITKHAYPEKVVVRNGYVYYAYKPNFDAYLNKLYRQKL